MSYNGIFESNNLKAYNSSGFVEGNLKIWTGTTTSTSGVWTIDISSAGFNSILFVGANARPDKTSNVGTADACFVCVSMQESNLSTIKGYAKEAVTAGALVATEMLNANTTVDVFVIGF